MFAPLAKVKVIDMTRILAGPFCTQLLSDWGAEVTKIERPFIGDDTRAWERIHNQRLSQNLNFWNCGNDSCRKGPPFDREGNAVYFHAVNRNKRSAAIDFGSQEGRDVILKMVENSDVFVENYIPGKLSKYGLSYEDLKAINPDLVYASLSGQFQFSS